MGVEDDTNGNLENGVAAVSKNGDDIASPSPPPPEEPPKLEEIITQEVLDDITKGYKADMKCVSFEAELGSKVGDNYMSIMYAVDMKLENSQGKDKELLKIMLKTLPRNAFRAEMINEMKAFKKESAIYQTVFPTLTQIQEEKGIPKALRFESWPKCYVAHLDGTTDYIAMENLRVDGYTMGNRLVGLDFNHCALVLRHLARYHALSYAKFEGKREAILEAFPVLDGGMFNKSNKNANMQQQFFSMSFKGQADTMRGMGEELAASRLEKLADIDFVDVLGALVENDVEVAVISHGDCWLNNMLFRYDDADSKCRFPINFKFLDFQISTATSRLVDIYYFLLTSCKLDVLGEYEQDLLRIYYAEFTSFVRMLGVDTKGKGLSWENFLKEGDRYRFYGIILGLVLAPMLAAEGSNIPDMDSFTEEDMKEPEEAMKSFSLAMTTDSGTKKSKTILLEHMPKCTGIENYL